MFASPAVYTRRSALAAQLRKLHLGIGQIFLRDMTTVMSNIRVGRPHTFYRAHDLLMSCACTDLRSAQLTALLSAAPLSPRAPGHRHARVHRAPDLMYSAGHILSAPSFLATLFPGLLIRRAFPLSASSGTFLVHTLSTLVNIFSSMSL